MGIEAADIDPGVFDAEFALEIRIQDADHLAKAILGDGLGHVGRGIWVVARATQPFGGQQHHHIGGVGLLGEELGVTAERDASLVDDPLVHRPGHHGGKFAVQVAVAGALQGSQHIGAVALIQLAWHHGAPSGHRADGQSPRPLRTGGAFSS